MVNGFKLTSGRLFEAAKARAAGPEFCLTDLRMSHQYFIESLSARTRENPIDGLSVEMMELPGDFLVLKFWDANNMSHPSSFAMYKANEGDERFAPVKVSWSYELRLVDAQMSVYAVPDLDLKMVKEKEERRASPSAEDLILRLLGCKATWLRMGAEDIVTAASLQERPENWILTASPDQALDVNKALESAKAVVATLQAMVVTDEDVAPVREPVKGSLRSWESRPGMLD